MPGKSRCRHGSVIKNRIEAARKHLKTVSYYNTDWQPAENLSLRLQGLNLDAVYEGFIRQVAGIRLEAQSGIDLKTAVERDGKRQILQREINALEKKIHCEKQFNRQIALNEELKQLKRQLEELLHG